MSCRKMQARLSEYLDNALGAHETWELEKHLAGCRECSRVLAELRRTVAAVQAAPRFEVSADFAASLQQRLAAAAPKPRRRAWLVSIPSMFRPRLLPAWGLATAAATLAVLAFLPSAPRGANVQPPPVPGPSREVQAARAHTVGLAAANPLEDVASANLAASMLPSDTSGAE